MIKDWRILKRVYDENGEEEVESCDFTVKELLEYVGDDSEIWAEFNAFRQFRDEEALMENVSHYKIDQIVRLITLFNAFSLWSKGLIVGLEAISRPKEKMNPKLYPYLLTLTLRAARHVDPHGVAQHLFVKLIYDIPKEELDYDAYQEAIQFLLVSPREDYEICKALLEEYHDRYKNDTEYWLYLGELEYALENFEEADDALSMVFERLPDDWKECGEEMTPRKRSELIDRCYQLGRDYAREHELVKRAWKLRRLLNQMRS